MERVAAASELDASPGASSGTEVVEARVGVAAARIDRPHISSTAAKQGRREVTVKAYWFRGRTRGTAYLWMTIRLQRWDGKGTWDTVEKTRRAKVIPRDGPGSIRRKRTVLSYRCGSASPSRFRADLDVDVPGVSDPPTKTEVGPVELPCR